MAYGIPLTIYVSYCTDYLTLFPFFVVTYSIRDKQHFHYILVDFLRFILHSLFDSDGNNGNWWHTEYQSPYVSYSDYYLVLMENEGNKCVSTSILHTYIFLFFVITYSIRDTLRLNCTSHTSCTICFWRCVSTIILYTHNTFAPDITTSTVQPPLNDGVYVSSQ